MVSPPLEQQGMPAENGAFEVVHSWVKLEFGEHPNVIVRHGA